MIFRNATVCNNDSIITADAFLSNGELVFGVSENIVKATASEEVFSDCLIMPGFCDVHVHLREPGFCYKETIESGTISGYKGGYTALCSMPNLKPVPDCPENLKQQTDIIKRSAKTAVFPYGSLTVEEKGETPSDMDGMAEFAVAFSDDGKGVQSEELMRELMLRAKRLGKVVACHCEENSLLNGGYIHDGDYARKHGHRGICSDSEWRPIERDLRLAEETGCAYHVCHISTKESVRLIRNAKKRGVDVTCETAPHYLVLSDKDIKEDGSYKMNPPLRDESDRLALLEGLADGTIDMIATDHAPHSAEEKSKGLEGSAFGIVGLETAFPVLYTELVKKNVIDLKKLVRLMSVNPRKRFNITSDVGFSVWDIKNEYIIDPNKFKSKGRATPFDGKRVFGKNILTVYRGKILK